MAVSPELRRFIRLTSAASVVVAAMAGCRGVPEMDPGMKEVGNETRRTECRGEVRIARMQRELSAIRQNIENISERPVFEKEVKSILEAFNIATCNIPDIRRGDLENNTVVLCGREMTLEMLRKELLSARRPTSERWDGRSSIQAFRDANPGCSDPTPTPIQASRKA